MRIDLDHTLLAPPVVAEYWESIVPAFVAATLAAGWSPVDDEFGVISPQGELRIAAEAVHTDGRQASFTIAVVPADDWSLATVGDA